MQVWFPTLRTSEGFPTRHCLYTQQKLRTNTHDGQLWPFSMMWVFFSFVVHSGQFYLSSWAKSLLRGADFVSTNAVHSQLREADWENVREERYGGSKCAQDNILCIVNGFLVDVVSLAHTLRYIGVRISVFYPYLLCCSLFCLSPLKFASKF